jgi:hypothetical protein
MVAIYFSVNATNYSASATCRLISATYPVNAMDCFVNPVNSGVCGFQTGYIYSRLIRRQTALQ